MFLMPHSFSVSLFAAAFLGRECRLGPRECGLKLGAREVAVEAGEELLPVAGAEAEARGDEVAAARDAARLARALGHEARRLQLGARERAARGVAGPRRVERGAQRRWRRVLDAHVAGGVPPTCGGAKCGVGRDKGVGAPAAEAGVERRARLAPGYVRVEEKYWRKRRGPLGRRAHGGGGRARSRRGAEDERLGVDSAQERVFVRRALDHDETR